MSAAVESSATVDAAVNHALASTLASVEARYAAANPASRAAWTRAQSVLPGGHTRQTLYFAPFPLVMTGGREARVTDLDGHEYLNLVGDYAAGLFGSSCEPLRAAAEEAMRRGISLSGLNAPESQLAELISRRIPSMEQVRFCNSGSEACLFAAQLARHATGRPKLLVFNGCYHGGFLIFGHQPAPLTVPIPALHATYNDVEGTRALLRANSGQLAAVFVEPMMGAGGAIPGTPEFLGMLRAETERLDILLVFDEVMTSRLAPGGVQELRGIRPDLTTLGKFWGGGFAFGAFGGARHVMRHMDPASGGALSQGGTFNNNVITMSAGLVGARDVYNPDACRRLNALGDWLREELCRTGRETGTAFQASGLGGVLNTHWSSGPIRNPGDVVPVSAPVRRLYQLEMIHAGFFVAARGMINLSLPMQERDLADFVAATRRFLAQYAQLLPRAGAA